MKKLALGLLTLIALGFGYLGVAYADDVGSGSAIAAAGSGSAAAATATPTVPDDPGQALSTATKLYKSGAWLCLGIVVVFLLLRYAANHMAWLKEDSRVHYVTAALAVLGALAVPASQGTTPNLQMVLAALGTIVAMFLPGAAPKQPAAS